MAEPFEAVAAVLQTYFDGLYQGDTTLLGKVFHPRALYATAVEGPLLALGMDEYFPIVEKRPKPAQRGDVRQDRVLSIEFVGPVTALAKVCCVIEPRHFTDLLTLVHVDGRWQIVAKVFHYDAPVVGSKPSKMRE